MKIKKHYDFMTGNQSVRRLPGKLTYPLKKCWLEDDILLFRRPISGLDLSHEELTSYFSFYWLFQ